MLLKQSWEKFLQPSSSGTSVTATQNNTLDERSGTATFTQAESGKTAAVSLSQKKGVESWVYHIKTNDYEGTDSIELSNYETSKAIYSYKRKAINGIEFGEQIGVPIEQIEVSAQFTATSLYVTQMSEQGSLSVQFSVDIDALKSRGEYDFACVELHQLGGNVLTIYVEYYPR